MKKPWSEALPERPIHPGLLATTDFLPLKRNHYLRSHLSIEISSG
jgi:hypothetical protein